MARPLCIVVFCALTALSGVAGSLAADKPEWQPGEHPRLFFTRGELPYYREKVRDGGPDDDAYRYIRNLVTTHYPTASLDTLMYVTFGAQFVPNLGLAAYLEEPEDEAVKALGRRIVLEFVDTYEPEDNEFQTPIGLRILTFAYDFFFYDADETERRKVRDEIDAYINMILTGVRFEKRLERPYLTNISTMIGSALGLAAICLSDEIPADSVDVLLDRADLYIDEWLKYQLDPDGSYKEGAMYAGWAMRHLAPYFWARKRFDGYDFSKRPGIREMENWLAFAVLPDGGAKINNINETAYLNRPLSRHFTYLEWAMTEWSSGLASWIWQRLVGPPYGYDPGELADKFATVLWHKDVPPVNPGDVLPRHFLWKGRGLYYYRTGWPKEEKSGDVVLSFFSGKFHGGHSQEDQNSFTLYGYGGMFAVDNGFENTAQTSWAHNMIFIDGKGQHHAGGTVGTDGDMKQHLLSNFADYLLGDATKAYTTYSEFNRPGYPFPDDDWSWGYVGANPVEFAFRRWLVVHDPATPPYFVLVDHIEKDDVPHLYEWRMHTLDTNQIDAAGEVIHVGNGSATMDIHAVSPPREAVTVRTEPFDNRSVDPNTTVLVLGQTTVSAKFTLLLVPGNTTTARPLVESEATAWGTRSVLRWPSGVKDLVAVNLGGDSRHWADRPATGPAREVETDAELLLLRDVEGSKRWIATNVSQLAVDGRSWAHVEGNKASIALVNDALYMDRDVRYRVYGPNVMHVYVAGREWQYRRDDDDVVQWDRSDTMLPGTPSVEVFPNPFNPTTTVMVHLDAWSWVDVMVYDVAGRRIRQLWTGYMPGGRVPVRWNGGTDAGTPAASGVYYVKVTTESGSTTSKVVLVR